MDVLWEWLRPLVEAALCAALRRPLPRGREYARYRDLRPVSCDDDDDGIFTFAFRDSRFVQVTR
ncbi:hypothetical protein KEM52_003656, partial [Ascosphaera acerosa]